MKKEDFKLGMEITENRPLKLVAIRDNVLFFKRDLRELSMHYNTFNGFVENGELIIKEDS